MDINSCEKRRQKIFNNEEWTNFKNLIDDVRELFQPDTATITRQVSKGTKLNNRRVSDVGIQMKNDYASGVLSEMITSGEQWFEFNDFSKNVADSKMFDYMTRLCYDAINASNFHVEMHRDQQSAAVDGTSCMYVERINGKMNFVHVPFGSFVFAQNYRGIPDTVWIEKTTTAGALVAEFGEDKVSERVKQKYESDPECEVKIIHYCAPRYKRDTSKKDNKNKPYELITYELDTKHLLSEGGTDIQKFLVYRIKRVNNETLGRGPCIDTAPTMAAVERCSKDMQRGLRLSVVPIFGIGASMGQSGVKWIHNDDASVMIYNDTGIAQPPQAMNPQTRPDFGQKYLEWMIIQMRGLFFLDYFNPLDNRRNMTLGEAKERVSKSQQMVDQIVGPLKEERINPLLRWVFILLGEAGEFKDFGSWDEIQNKMAGRIEIRYCSRLANVQKKIRMMSIAEFAQTSMAIAQGIPDQVMAYEFMSRIKWDEIPNEIQDGTNAPLVVLRDKKEAKNMAQEFAKGLAQQAQTDNMVKVADASSKGGTSPQAGSLTSMILGGQ